MSDIVVLLVGIVIAIFLATGLCRFVEKISEKIAEPLNTIRVVQKIKKYLKKRRPFRWIFLKNSIGMRLNSLENGIIEGNITSYIRYYKEQYIEEYTPIIMQCNILNFEKLVTSLKGKENDEQVKIIRKIIGKAKSKKISEKESYNIMKNLSEEIYIDAIISCLEHEHIKKEHEVMNEKLERYLVYLKELIVFDKLLKSKDQNKDSQLGSIEKQLKMEAINIKLYKRAREIYIKQMKFEIEENKSEIYEVSRRLNELETLRKSGIEKEANLMLSYYSMIETICLSVVFLFLFTEERIDALKQVNMQAISELGKEMPMLIIILFFTRGTFSVIERFREYKYYSRENLFRTHELEIETLKKALGESGVLGDSPSERIHPCTDRFSAR